MLPGRAVPRQCPCGSRRHIAHHAQRLMPDGRRGHDERRRHGTAACTGGGTAQRAGDRDESRCRSHDHQPRGRIATQGPQGGHQQWQPGRVGRHLGGGHQRRTPSERHAGHGRLGPARKRREHILEPGLPVRPEGGLAQVARGIGPGGGRRAEPPGRHEGAGSQQCGHVWQQPLGLVAECLEVTPQGAGPEGHNHPRKHEHAAGQHGPARRTHREPHLRNGPGPAPGRGNQQRHHQRQQRPGQ